MEVGDIVFYATQPWVVSAFHALPKVFQLVDLDGNTREVIPEEPDLFVVGQPNTWPFLVCPLKLKAGPLVQVSRTHQQKTTRLRPLMDWVSSDIGRAGGPVFFNPMLGICAGDSLVATHRNGALSRISISPGFGSSQDRLKKKLGPKKELQTTYDKLMADYDPYGDK